MQESLRLAHRKGIGLIVPNRDVDDKWQHKQSRGQLRGLPREFSVLVNKHFLLGIGLTGDGEDSLGKVVTFGPLGCALDAP